MTGSQRDAIPSAVSVVGGLLAEPQSRIGLAHRIRANEGHIAMSRRKATLVGIAGSFNAMSLSLYNLKAYAVLTDPAIPANWDIDVLQRKLITPGSDVAEQMIAQTVDAIVSSQPDLV
jgi:hypothetical protein